MNICHTLNNCPNPVECTISKVSLSVNSELWLIMMCQPRYSWSKCTTQLEDVDSGRGYAHECRAYMGGFLYSPFNFALKYSLVKILLN